MYIVYAESSLIATKIGIPVFEVGVSKWPNFKTEIRQHQLCLRSQTKPHGEIWKPYHQQNNSFSFTRRYFQGNSETCRTEIIEKLGIGFHDNESFLLSLLLIFYGNI